MLFGKRERTIRRIIIVEDEPLIAFDAEHLLSEAGYEVVATVDNPGDAFDVMARERLDLVICDIGLRNGDGLEVARKAATRGIPLLFITGQCPPDAQCLALGQLAKPYTDKSLKAALEALDRMRQGVRVRKLPPGLTLFSQAGDPPAAPPAPGRPARGNGEFPSPASPG